jgi:prephenate dehydrogenase
MWRDIFLWNRDNVVSFIEAYERSLSQLKQLIQVSDAAGIEKKLDQAKQEREKLSTRPTVPA